MTQYDDKKYPLLSRYTARIKEPVREIIGRENETNLILATFSRAEVSNVLLLAPAGSGKTATVQATMKKDVQRLYLEVDLSKMIANMDESQLAGELKLLFDEAEKFAKEEAREIVLFMDEFHQVVQLSVAAVEALKPLLAMSGTRKIRVIAATTYDEFFEYISKNQPLVERFTRVDLKEPDKNLTVKILKTMADTYNISRYFPTDDLFSLIYEYTTRYMPSNNQPRKSILVLDAMYGWHKCFGMSFGMKLLAKVLYDIQGVDVAFNVDATKIKERLDEKVYAQELATQTIAKRLQLCVADLNDHEKPMSSFLFTGSTGVGKMVTNDTLIPVSSDKVYAKYHGDLEVGDVVFHRTGTLEKVIGVFPQGMQDVYRVHLGDGRYVDCGLEHLWTYKKLFGKDKGKWKTQTLREMIKNGIKRNGRYKFAIPMNHKIQWREQEFDMNDLENMKITDKMLYNSISNRRRVVRYLFDRNGFIDDYRRLIYKFDDEEHLKKLRKILFSLGIGSVLKKDTLKILCNDKYKVFLFEDRFDEVLDRLVPFKNTKKYDSVKIVKVEFLGQKECSCIKIENDDGLYQVNDFVVTHNTAISKELANILFKDHRAMLRFDMSEYALDESLERFRVELTSRVWSKPNSIILLDEIEKACSPVVRLLLQVLDDGRLLDKHNREVSFTNCYVIMTTNAGSEIYKNIAQYNESDTGDGLMMADYQPLIRRSLTKTTGGNKFPPELLGRIDCIVPFQPLSSETMKRIVMTKLNELKIEVKRKHNKELLISPKVIEYLVNDTLTTDSDSGGARRVIGSLETEVTTEVAKFINEHPKATKIGVTIQGTMKNEDKKLLKSQARVAVGIAKSKK